MIFQHEAQTFMDNRNAEITALKAERDRLTIIADAIQAERDRLRAALEEIAQRKGACENPSACAPIARRALEGK
jgi:hypothetical protein